MDEKYRETYEDDELMTMNCFCDMVDGQKAFSFIFSRNYCQRSSPSRISDMPWAELEPVENLSSGLVEWSCAVAMTTIPRRSVSMTSTVGVGGTGVTQKGLHLVFPLFELSMPLSRDTISTRSSPWYGVTPNPPECFESWEMFQSKLDLVNN